MNVLLAGEESAGIQTLKALAHSEHRIVAVMALPSKKSFKSEK
jgi:methionyl-tRNA formyltransferase